MRVALVPSQYLPNLGGVEELTRNLATNLAKCGDEVEVWAPFPEGGRRPPVEYLGGVRVRRFAFPLPRAHPASAWPLLREGLPTLQAMLRATREFRPDVFNVQCFGPNGVYTTAVSLLTGVPLVLSLQGETVMDDNDIYSVSSTMRLALRIGLRSAGSVTGCSRFTLRDAEVRFGLREGVGKVIFNDADPDLNAPGGDTTLPHSLSHLDGKRYVAALGRVVDKKGFDLLLDAFREIASSHGDVDLVIGGAGPRLEDLRRRAAEFAIADRVHFPGRLSRDEVAQVMAAACVFVMPSRLEPFGIVVLEAWRAGTAVIATSIGGPPEFVSDGVDGLLVDPHDTRSLADALDRLLGDADLRCRVAEAGRRRFSDFVWPALTFEYRRVYAGLARARPGRIRHGSFPRARAAFLANRTSAPSLGTAER